MLKSNILEYGVAEFSQVIKKKIEASFEYLIIKGEITGYTPPNSKGYIYFVLKEGNFKLNVTCFKNLSKIGFALENGLQVRVAGKITAYGDQSKYQIVLDSIQLDGVGAMMMAVEKLKKKLTAEGLFDEKHKKPIPFLSNIIGIITSSTGAVIQDMHHRIQARFPTNIVLYPTLVQGNEAASQVIAGVQYFNNLTCNKPDLLIIARGGGSFEDLMPFNDEALIRAVFACNIPVISAIGHEPDFTLLDYVADKRAPTPTAAAEFATPVRADLQQKLIVKQQRLQQISNNYLMQQQQKLTMSYKSLPDLARFLKDKSNFLQNLCEKQQMIIKNYLMSQQNKINVCKIPNLDNIFSNLTQKIQYLQQQINGKMVNILQQKHTQLAKITIDKTKMLLFIENSNQKLINKQKQIAQKLVFYLEKQNSLLRKTKEILTSYHYDNVLKRGFAIVYNQKKQPITSIKTAQQEKNLIIKMQDGEILVQNNK
jgi:exodeoxyribonuclease VII large subunit